MTSAQPAAGKIRSRTLAGAPAEVSAGAAASEPRILELLLRIPVGDFDEQPSPEQPALCDCERGGACPFRMLCAD
jgi:hypothetical protein